MSQGSCRCLKGHVSSSVSQIIIWSQGSCLRDPVSGALFQGSCLRDSLKDPVSELLSQGVSKLLCQGPCLKDPVSGFLSQGSCVRNPVLRIMTQGLGLKDPGARSQGSCLKDPVSRILSQGSCVRGPVSRILPQGSYLKDPVPRIPSTRCTCTINAKAAPTNTQIFCASFLDPFAHRQCLCARSPKTLAQKMCIEEKGSQTTVYLANADNQT